MTAKPNNSRAFTLTEVMLSVALVLILLLGVNSVFRMTSDTVGAGQAISSINRDHRAVQATLYRDVQNAVKAEAPFLIIVSQRIPAFRNQQDRLSDLNYDPTSPTETQILSADLDGNNNETGTGETIHPTNYNFRNHRADILTFFVRDLLPRQTGNDGVFAANMSSYEGLVWYGHLAVYNDDGDPDDDANYPAPGQFPGAEPNPNNFDAAQWILGRQAILLKDKVDTDLDGDFEILDNDGVPQSFIDRDWTNVSTMSAKSLSPLEYLSDSWNAKTDSTDTTVQLYNSRYDLAAVSMDMFSQRVSLIDVGTPPPNWYDFLSTTNITRYQVKPIPDVPISATGMARSSPIFLRGCTQFMVEYAGDFLKQAANGDVDDMIPDGTTDFVVVNIGTPNERRSTRWYGFPRDIDRDGDIQILPTSPDVGPLRDMRALSATPPVPPATIPASFERDIDARLPLKANYAATGASGMEGDDVYICAWSNNTTEPFPRMLRIVVSVDDSLNRINEAQTFEYVIELP